MHKIEEFLLLQIKNCKTPKELTSVLYDPKFGKEHDSYRYAVTNWIEHYKSGKLQIPAVNPKELIDRVVDIPLLRHIANNDYYNSVKQGIINWIENYKTSSTKSKSDWDMKYLNNYGK